jgi:hypothetical protein
MGHHREHTNVPEAANQDATGRADGRDSIALTIVEHGVYVSRSQGTVTLGFAGDHHFGVVDVYAAPKVGRP